MASSFFIDMWLKRKLNKDVKKRAKLEKQEAKHLKEFYKKVDKPTIERLFEWITQKGYKKHIKTVNELKEKMELNTLSSNDALEMLDLYEIYADKIKEE